MHSQERKNAYDVLVVTGNTLMRQHEQQVLPNLFGIPAERIRFTSTLEETLQIIDSATAARDGIGVIVTDLSQGGVSIGTVLIEYVNKRGLRIPVVIKSVQLEQPYGAGLIRKGAFAYYQKDKPVEELAGKVREALAQPRN